MGTLVVAAPALALAALSVATANVVLAWVALGVAVGLGGGVLVVGTAKGGQALDRRWPEVLAAVAFEKA